MLSLIGIFSSCAGNSEESEKVVEYIPVQFEKDGRWSLMSEGGNIKFKDAFKNEPTQVVNSLFSVEEENGFALYRIDGDKYELVNDLYGLSSVGEPNCGLIPICRRGERLSVVNLEGVKQFDLLPVNGREIVSCNTRFDDDMLPVIDEENKYGFFGKTGTCVIPPAYDVALPFSEGKAVALKDSEWCVIDKAGNILFRLKNGQVPMADWMYKYGKLCARDADKPHFYVYNNMGDATKLSDEIFAIEDFNDRYIIFREGEDRGYIWGPNETKGLMTFDGTVIVHPIYKELIFTEDDKILLSKDGFEWSMWNPSENRGSEIRLDYRNVSFVNGFGYIAKGYKHEFEAGHDDDMFILNKQGESIKDIPKFINVGERLWSGNCVSQYIPVEKIAMAVSDIENSGIGGFNFNNSKTEIANAVGVSPQPLEIQIDSIKIGSSRIREFVFGTDKIQHFKISIETPVTWGNQGVRDLVKAFTAKGFQETQHRNHGTSGTISHLIKNGISLFIEFHDDDFPHLEDEEPQKYIDIYIKKDLTEKDISNWLNEFEWMYDVPVIE